MSKVSKCMLIVGLAWVIILIGLAAACQRKLDPAVTPTDQFETAASPAIVMTTERPSPSVEILAASSTSGRTLEPTQTPFATAIALATPTLPLPTTAITTPTPEIIWANGVNVLKVIETYSVVWSPTDNDFLFDTCPPDPYTQPSYAAIVRSNPSNISQLFPVTDEFLCPAFGVSIAWSPDGQNILYTAAPVTENTQLDYVPEVGDIWITNREGQNPFILLPHDKVGTRWNPGFVEWIDGETVRYSGYAGGGHSRSTMLNIRTGEQSRSIVAHAGGISARSGNYLGGDSGVGTTYDTSAIAVSISESWNVNPNLTALEHLNEAIGGSHVYHLSTVFADPNGPGYDLNSRFMSWLPGTDKMLVLTWEAGLDIVADSPPTQLQLWDIGDNSLTLIVPGAVFGRFSPDGRYLAFAMFYHGESYLQLLDWETGQYLLATPLHIDITYHEHDYSYMTMFGFSPNSQYFFFRTQQPTLDSNDQSTAAPTDKTNLLLNVFDMFAGRWLLSTPCGCSSGPVWSPNNQRLFSRTRKSSGLLWIYQTAGLPP
jgi:hypothetical protein